MTCAFTEYYYVYKFCLAYLHINECVSVEMNICSSNAECNYTAGSYTCTCNDGYVGDGLICEDINECFINNGCHEQATCFNVIGSYMCECRTGFIGDGYNCIDYDECADNAMLWGSGATCVNLPGTYECVYIDECLLGISECTQVCSNSVPLYTCSCQDSFQLESDGVTCTEISPCDVNCENGTCYKGNEVEECLCNLGFELTDNSTCKDMDECAGNNTCEMFCSNLIGGYECSCSEGYELDSDFRTCRDIDECLAINNCSSNAICGNTEGGYNCTCSSGYIGTGYECYGHRDGSDFSKIYEYRIESNKQFPDMEKT
ncbi:fibrillin-1-like [Anneissia japonica]|uniref:fibrillin-1-like n=1 Tax=Anneissia japonica TaxID=1529436 RepID=UPI0014257303|nr:fibrillin-1-like [Anneissia japonica]